MKVVLCFLLALVISFAVNAQQSPVPAVPTLTQEERRGEIVCAVYRQYGAPDVVTISAAGNVDFSKQDIVGCVQAVRQKLNRLQEGMTKQGFQKNS